MTAMLSRFAPMTTRPPSWKTMACRATTAVKATTAAQGPRTMAASAAPIRWPDVPPATGKFNICAANMNAAMTPKGRDRALRQTLAGSTQRQVNRGSRNRPRHGDHRETEKAVGRVQRAHSGAEEGERREDAGQQGHHFVGPGSSEHRLHTPASTVWLRSAEKPYFS